MTKGEQWIVGGVVLAGAGLAAWYLWQQHKLHEQSTLAKRIGTTVTPPKGGTFSSVGDSIAAIGGAAVAQLGKEAGSWAESKLSSLFS